jgi:hypothetical protein
VELSSEAAEEWEKIRETYVGVGYPNYRVWWFESQGSDEVDRELEAVRYIEPRGGARYGLTHEGLVTILGDVEMSDEAVNLRDDVRREYIEKKFPAFKTYIFACEREDKAVSELIARGFVEYFAAGGRSFRFADFGQRWVMSGQ